MIRRLLASMLIALALGAWLAPAVAAEPRTYLARLEPVATCPSAVEAGAQGLAIFRVNKEGTEVTYRLITTGLDRVTAAHIHRPGGSVAQGLFAGPTTGTVNGVLAAGTFPATQDVLTQLESGTGYVNVHTAYPGCGASAIQGTIEQVGADAAQ